MRELYSLYIYILFLKLMFKLFYIYIFWKFKIILSEVLKGYIKNKILYIYLNKKYKLEKLKLKHYYLLFLKYLIA